MAASEYTYTCTLSDDVLRMAKEELNEDPETRMLEIKAFRDRLLQYPGLQPQTDPKFLLQFLRARKFDQERAFQMIINYYRMRHARSKILAGLKPSHVAPLFNAPIQDLVICPFKDRKGRAVHISRGGMKEPNRFGSDELTKYAFVGLYKSMEVEEKQVTGYLLVLDFKSMTLGHLRNWGINNTASSDLMDKMPHRIKTILLLNESVIVDVMLEFFSRMISSKMYNRIVRLGTDWKKLHEYIDPVHLPAEYGGTSPLSMEQLALNWASEALADDNFLDEENKHGFVDFTIGQETSRGQQDAITNMAGTFKKLNV